MGRSISVIVPNYNGGRTIGRCLEALFASSYDNFEVIVVDDCSSDGSAEIIRRFPCRPVLLDERSGASRARNIGAQNSAGEVLFLSTPTAWYRGTPFLRWTGRLTPEKRR